MLEVKLPVSSIVKCPIICLLCYVSYYCFQITKGDSNANKGFKRFASLVSPLLDRFYLPVISIYVCIHVSF